MAKRKGHRHTEMDDLITKQEAINLVENFAQTFLAHLDTRYTRQETTDERQGQPTPAPAGE